MAYFIEYQSWLNGEWLKDRLGDSRGRLVYDSIESVRARVAQLRQMGGPFKFRIVDETGQEVK